MFAVRLLTNRKSSVHLHALYSSRTELRTFTPRRDQLVVCGQYIYCLPHPSYKCTLSKVDDKTTSHSFSTRVRSGATPSAQQASQEMGATREGVHLACGFRSSVPGTSVRIAVASQPVAIGPAVRSTQTLE
jgi:hypothetical protein